MDFSHILADPTSEVGLFDADGRELPFGRIPPAPELRFVAKGSGRFFPDRLVLSVAGREVGHVRFTDPFPVNVQPGDTINTTIAEAADDPHIVAAN